MVRDVAALQDIPAYHDVNNGIHPVCYTVAYQQSHHHDTDSGICSCCGFQLTLLVCHNATDWMYAIVHIMACWYVLEC